MYGIKIKPNDPRIINALEQHQKNHIIDETDFNNVKEILLNLTYYFE